MDSLPPDEETSKDYATRRIENDEPAGAVETPPPEAEKKSRTRKTAPPPASDPSATSAVTVPVEEAPAPLPPLPPAEPPEAKGPAPRNERVWIAAIAAICVLLLACLCSCTFLAAVYIARMPR